MNKRILLSASAALLACALSACTSAATPSPASPSSASARPEARPAVDGAGMDQYQRGAREFVSMAMASHWSARDRERLLRPAVTSRALSKGIARTRVDLADIASVSTPRLGATDASEPVPVVVTVSDSTGRAVTVRMEQGSAGLVDAVSVSDDAGVAFRPE